MSTSALLPDPPVRSEGLRDGFAVSLRDHEAETLPYQYFARTGVQLEIGLLLHVPSIPAKSR
jgi:hypothetical protein